MMLRSQLQGRVGTRLTAAATACAVALLLSGCSSVSHVIADHWPHWAGGLPEGVPPRPETPPQYMPVHNLPPPREDKPMTAAERQKMEADMAAVRGQSAAQAEEAKREAPARAR